MGVPETVVSGISMFLRPSGPIKKSRLDVGLQMPRLVAGASLACSWKISNGPRNADLRKLRIQATTPKQVRIAAARKLK